MKVAIDIAPVSNKSTSFHKVRGVGAYINMLIENLARYDPDNEYVFVEDKKFPKDLDLIHYPYFDPFFITLPFRSSKKFVVTVHDLTPLVFPSHFTVGIKGNIKWSIQKMLLRHASKITTDSDASGKDVHEIVGIDKNKIQTVYLAVDEKFKRVLDSKILANTKRKYDLPDKFLLYVGDATWNKNLPRLIGAVLQTKYPLALVGKVWESDATNDNPWNRDLKNVLSKIRGDNQFIRLGFVEDQDLINIYNLAEVLLMPSIYEGFGLPVLEAFMCGCPVITSRNASLPEVAREGALYIDHQSVESIARGIERIVNDKELRQRLIEKGLKQSKKFSIEKSIKDIVSVYREVINE